MVSNGLGACLSVNVIDQVSRLVNGLGRDGPWRQIGLADR
jgi:hypothetical protein